MDRAIRVYLSYELVDTANITTFCQYAKGFRYLDGV